MIVADASLLVHLLIPSPDSALAEGVYRKDPKWSAPVLWRSELRRCPAQAHAAFRDEDRAGMRIG
jgi:hypothetical protein